MTKRYFYDCPIKGAFMVKYHGMKIHGPARMPTGGIGTSTKPMPVWVLARAIEHAEKGVGPENARYYLAEESVKLLEPDIGDMVWLKSFSAPQTLTKDDCLPVIGEYFTSIIQRNGMAFMHPESEDADGQD